MLRLTVILLLPLLPVRAQTPEQQPASDPLGRTTPYGCVFGFLKAAAAHDYSLAAEYLDLRGAALKGPELAEKLQIVLDRGLSGNLARLSRDPGGDAEDGLPPNHERAGSVATGEGSLSIDLERIPKKGEPSIWLFSSTTLRDVPSVAEMMQRPAILRLIPSPLMEAHFLYLPLWRWLLLVVGLSIAFGSASLVTHALFPLLKPVVRRLTGGEDDRLLASLRRPVCLLLLAVSLRLIAVYGNSVLERQWWRGLATLLTIIGSAWLTMRFAGIVTDLKARRLVQLGKLDKIAILRLGDRVFNIAVFFAGVVLVLERAGVNITAMLAGLGIGGVALALAAQKTLENVFGGISLVMREAVRVGDVCTVAGQTGTVEDIGLGALSLRSFDRTLISVPNAQLAQLSMENISLRDKFWLHQTFGLRYDTSAQQVRGILEGIEGILGGIPEVENSTARARLVGFGTSSITLELYAYIRAADYDAFLGIQETLLLSVLDVIARQGASVSAPLLVNDLTPEK